MNQYLLSKFTEETDLVFDLVVPTSLFENYILHIYNSKERLSCVFEFERYSSPPRFIARLLSPHTEILRRMLKPEEKKRTCHTCNGLGQIRTVRCYKQEDVWSTSGHKSESFMVINCPECNHET